MEIRKKRRVSFTPTRAPHEFRIVCSRTTCRADIVERFPLFPSKVDMPPDASLRPRRCVKIGQHPVDLTRRKESALHRRPIQTGRLGVGLRTLGNRYMCPRNGTQQHDTTNINDFMKNSHLNDTPFVLFTCPRAKSGDWMMSYSECRENPVLGFARQRRDHRTKKKHTRNGSANPCSRHFRLLFRC